MHMMLIFKVDGITGDQMTYRCLKARVESVSAALVRRYGCVKGDALAFYSTNNLELIVIVLAAIRVGLVVSGIHTVKTTGRWTEGCSEKNNF